MSAPQFVHSERELADAIGVPQKKLRTLRADELDRGEDWDHTPGGEVRYSDAGHAKLCAALKIEPAPAAGDVAPPRGALLATLRARATPDSAPNIADAKKIDESLPPALASRPTAAGFDDVAMQPHTIDQLLRGTVEELTCVKCYRPNKRMLEAKRANGQLVLVRVKDNMNLRAGMTMTCRFGSGRTWELAQRLPRYPGKW